MANLLASYRTTVTMVTRLQPCMATSGEGACGHEREEGMEGCGNKEEACPDWEALKLQLSREEISKGTELESLIVSDLTIRHQKYIHH